MPKCKNPPPPPLVSRESLKLSLENSLKANKALAKMNDRLEHKCPSCGRKQKKNDFPEFPKDRPYKQ